MKNLFFVLTISAIIFGCENCVDQSFTFQNKSGKKIVVTSYKNYYPDIPFETISKIFMIENEANISRVEKDCQNRNINILGIGNVLEGDSIVIDFGDKKIGYGIKNLSSNRNIYFLAKDVPFQPNFVYTVTAADYANAP